MVSRSRWCIGLVLALQFGIGSAAEPVVAQPRPDATARVPLDLSTGDLTRYMDAAELTTPLPEGIEEIIVNGQRPEPLPERPEIPHGVFPALFYGVTHPLNAWRIILPDYDAQIPDRTIDDPRDPPGAFRGKILEPGAIYD